MMLEFEFARSGLEDAANAPGEANRGGLESEKFVMVNSHVSPG